VKPFNRRIYPNVRAFWRDLKAILARREQMRPLMRGELLAADFRERLMLAVTAVNGCRYCSFVHAKQALVEGIGAAEIRALLDGRLEDSPSEELPALMYAQHWAESRGQPEREVRERLVAAYGEQKAGAIELGLRTIQMGNLMGNTLDYVLFRLSFGRWGLNG
jgi:AhpD family alkylhydroperoxidase